MKNDIAIDQATAKSFSLPRIVFTGANAAFPTKPKVPKIKRVLVNGPATIVFWNDGTKNIVKKHDEDEYNLRQAILEAFYDKVTGITKKDKKAYFNRLLNQNSKKVTYNLY